MLIFVMKMFSFFWDFNFLNLNLYIYEQHHYSKQKIQQQHCNNIIMKEQQMRTATLRKQHCNNTIMNEQQMRTATLLKRINNTAATLQQHYYERTSFKKTYCWQTSNIRGGLPRWMSLLKNIFLTYEIMNSNGLVQDTHLNWYNIKFKYSLAVWK